MALSIGDDDMAERLVISSLPLETRFPPFQLRQHGGFWPSDVFLASFPKSGTTWLKALAFATAHRADHPPRAPNHPLRLRNPHDCVEFLEVPYALDPTADAFAVLPAPRVIATHMPYSLLPELVTAEGAGRLRFHVAVRKEDAAAAAAGAANDDEPRPVPKPFSMEEALELFCVGRCPGGPQWPHVLSYWEASRRWPEKVLFLQYEEMLRTRPRGWRGRDIVELCSIGALKNVEANKSGAQNYVKNEAFFRKGVAGDWSNHVTPAMAARLDGIVEDALQGSGFAFAAAGRQA
ncbi:hypothetical protein VPH35_016606 [Triticum aestivum]